MEGVVVINSQPNACCKPPVKKKSALTVKIQATPTIKKLKLILYKEGINQMENYFY
jgi:hypothetical protein